MFFAFSPCGENSWRKNRDLVRRFSTDVAATQSLSSVADSRSAVSRTILDAPMQKVRRFIYSCLSILTKKETISETTLALSSDKLAEPIKSLLSTESNS
jgi:hypothetical protein